MESRIGRQPSRSCDPLVVPQAVIDWCEAVRAGNGGNLSGLEVGPEQIPAAQEVAIEADAMAAMRAYERRTLELMNQLEDERLDELHGRSFEKALKVAAILAVSVDPRSPRVTSHLAQWAIDYVHYSTEQTVESVRRYMHGSQFGQWRTAVLDVIAKGGVRGRTERELAKYCRPYAGLEPRQRKAVLDSLKGEGAIEYVKTKGASGRGRERCAWVALDEDGDSDE